MRTLVVSLSTWVLMLYSVCGVWTMPGVPVELSVGIGRCSLNFNARALVALHDCLCAGFQACSVQLSYGHVDGIRPVGKAAGVESPPSHYVCQTSCRRQLFSYKVNSFYCHAVTPDEIENKCQEGLECKNIRLDLAKTCTRCIDIGWSKPEEIKVSIGHRNMFQHGQCPREGEVTKRSTSVETSVDLSTIFSTASAVLSNATTPSEIFPSVTFTEGSAAGSGGDLVRLIVLLVLGILVLAIGVTAGCVICLRRGKTAGKQRLSEIYMTPIDVVYSSTEFLAQRLVRCTGLVSHEGSHASGLDRSSHIARENDYSDVSYPGSCSQGPGQASENCAGMTSVHEHAEGENVYADLDKTARTEGENVYADLDKTSRTEEASSKPHYANMCSFLENNSSTKQATARTVTDAGIAQGNRLSQASTNESNYSIINDCAKRTDNTLKHSFTCENASVVCGDVEGPYKIMKRTTTHVSANTKKANDSSSSSTKLSNNMVYTRLRDNSERVSNVYDVLVTDTDDATFDATLKSADFSSRMDTEDEYMSACCPLHNKQCSEDCLNGSVYENPNRGLNVEGTYINNAMISDTTPDGIYNCVVDDDKAMEPESPYVNYTVPDSEEQAPPPSTCHKNDAVTNIRLQSNGYSHVISCASNNNGLQSNGYSTVISCASNNNGLQSNGYSTVISCASNNNGLQSNGYSTVISCASNNNGNVC